MTQETIAQQVSQLLQRQLSEWPEAHDNYVALEHVLMREIELGDSLIVLQYNPLRRQSSSARLDAASLSARSCFLCREHQPAQQDMVEWGDGRYKIQLNPYPIFPRHLTIAAMQHTPQSIADPRRVSDMIQLAKDLPDYVVFYNGPKCGASAPDHMHFQAGTKGYMPLCTEVMNPAFWPEEHQLLSCADGFLAFAQRFGRFCFFIKTSEPVLAELYFARLQVAMMMAAGKNEEPMQNVLCWVEDDDCHLLVFPRRKHRPACYGTDKENFLLSPASVDMGGLWTVPEKKDYERLDADIIQRLYDELCLDNENAVAVIDHLLYSEEP